jgi:hypothetical protein
MGLGGLEWKPHFRRTTCFEHWLCCLGVRLACAWYEWATLCDLSSNGRGWITIPGPRFDQHSGPRLTHSRLMHVIQAFDCCQDCYR